MTKKKGASIPVPVAEPEKMAWYELNDLGNADRLIDLAGGKLLWVEDHWRAYDGRRWSAEDGARLSQQLAHDMARHIPIEAAALDDAADAETDPGKKTMLQERAAALYKHAVQSGNANKTTAALAQAKSKLAATRDDFDGETMALNVANGTLRFFEGPDGWAVRLDAHDPEDRISRMSEVAWEPGAQCPEFARHMETVLPAPDVRRYFQSCMGYALTGEISEQCIFLLQGKGGDGKSTTMDVLREVLGGYGATAAVESFLHGAARSGAEASPDMARLAGDVRLVCTSEPRIGAMIDEGRVKQITGGQPISARELHGAVFEYRPRFAIVFECNRKPRISGDDDGIWRRIVVIEFPHQFKGAADKTVGRRLLAEAEGVLGWLVQGTLMWLNHGLIPPETVRAAIEDYRRSSNPFGEWFGERVATDDPEARALSADLYADYKQFCEDNAVGDREIMTSTAFGRALGDKQLAKAKNAQGKVIRKGCRLRTLDELSLPPAGVQGGGDIAGGAPDRAPGNWGAGAYDDQAGDDWSGFDD